MQYDLDVPDFAKAPFSMSGAGDDVAVRRRTTADGAARRAAQGGAAGAAGGRCASFPQNDEIALFAEVYDNAGGTPHKVDITTTVTTDEGKRAVQDRTRSAIRRSRRQERRLRLHDEDSAQGYRARATTC